jgi:hypothetical protein
MFHPEVAIHPRIRLVDWSPSRASQLDSGKVEGGDVVCVVLKATMYASEEGLAFPVGFVDVSASWAGYGSVFRLGID